MAWGARNLISTQARRVERKYPSFSRGSALDGRGFINDKAHEAAHHYVKVVSTHFDVGSFLSSLSADASTAVGYQTLVQTQTMAYHELDVPEAKFSYDLSPMAVAVRTTGKRWYDFVTSICAIVGGTFTTVGLIDALTSGIVATNAMFRSAAAGPPVVSAASIESRATRLVIPHAVPL